MSSKYIGNSADLGQGIYTVQDVQEKIKTDSWPVKYNIENSLRFNGTNSSLTRTPTNFVGTSTKTWTISCWIKLGNTSNFYILDTTAGSAEETLRFDAGLIDYVHYQTSVTQRALSPSYYRDLSQWYHLVASADTTQPVQNDRMKYFINGQQITNLSFTGFGPNDDLGFNKNELHVIGRRNSYNDRWANGYLADLYFVDGQALSPSHFAYTNPVTNKWVPKAYKGTYGTNGFHLEFKNTGTHTGVGGIGEDTSGNGNHWAVSNFTADDVVPDSPTNNFCTINSLHAMPGRTDFATLLDGSLTINTGTNSPSPMFSSFEFPKSGKWYWEIYLGGSYTGIFSGIRDTEEKSGVTYYQSLYYSYNSAGSATTIATPNNTAVGAVHGYYVDFDAGIFRAYLNGTPQGDVSMLERFGDVLYTRHYHAYFADGASAFGTTQTVNFGQDPTFANNKVPTKVYTDSNGYGKFYYEPPAGALALCEANINQPENTVSEYVVDETGNHTLTYNGGVGISKFSPYAPDGYSINFDGSSRLYDTSNANYNIGTSDYSIECWIYYTDITNAAFFQTETDLANSSGRLWFGYLSGELTVSIHGSGTYWVGTVWNPTRYKWYHVAAKRESGIVSIYIDGVNQTISGTNPNTIQNGVSISQNGISVGVRSGGSGTFFKGYITDLKFNIGGISSTVGTIPTSVISDVNTKLLLKNENNSFKDFSSLNNTLTIGGSPEISDWSPFIPKPDVGFRRVEDYGGGSSFYFDGSGDYLSPYTSKEEYRFLHNGTTSFTAESWVYIRSAASANVIYDSNGTSTTKTGVALYINTNRTIACSITNSAGGGNGIIVITSTETINLNEWNHICFTYDPNAASNNANLYLNGTLINSANKSTTLTPSSADSTHTFTIGTYSDGAGTFFNGYMSDFRIIKGSVVSPASGGPTSKLDPTVTNTDLLLQPWHTKPARSSVYQILDSYKNDETGKSLTYYNGATTVDSSPYKGSNFGSFNFDGIDDYLGLPTLTAFGTNDWTIEFWFKETKDNSGSYHGLIFLYTPTTSLRFQTALYSGTLHFYTYDGNWRNTGWAPTVNKWHHVAITREFSSTTLTFRVDGVQVYTNATVGGRDYTADWDSNKLAHHSVYTSCQITDLRIIKGVALYTADFIPPTEPLTQTNETVLLLQPGKTSTVNVAAKKPEKHFHTLLYSGTGQTQSITGLDFQPDLVWLKNRTNGTSSHGLYDVLRGPGYDLRSDDTAASTNYPGYGVNSFNSNGFQVIGNGNVSNSTGNNFVAWCWKAGGSPSADGVAMVDGSATTTSALKDAAGASITPTRMSVNTKAGFSIVKYTGNATAGATVPHGLNDTPSMIIVKNLDASTQWGVYHQSLAANEILQLAVTNVIYPNSGVFNGTSPTSNVFYLGGNTNIDNYSSGNNFIAYCWHSVPGYSAFGSYEGNQNADGPFIYTGFRPAFVLTKPIDFAENWAINDSARSPNNPVDLFLRPDEPSQEVSSAATMDFLSNGFKLRTTDTKTNVSSTIIYAAFAEQPFTRTNAR